jgi:hypothetical protein
MTTFLRAILVAASASTLGVAALASAPAPGDNVLELVIGGGPHAGTYKLPASAVMCAYFKEGKNLAAIYKDFDASDVKTVSDAAINVLNPDEAAPKWGSVLVAFGGRDGKRGARYDVKVTGNSVGSLSVARKGKAADLAFQGQTKDGISLHLTARCMEIETL